MATRKAKKKITNKSSSEVSSSELKAVKTLLATTGSSTPQTLAAEEVIYVGEEGTRELINKIKGVIPDGNLFLLQDPLYYFEPAENSTLTKTYNLQTGEWVDGMRYVTIVCESGMQFMDGFSQYTYRLVGFNDAGDQVSATSVATTVSLSDTTMVCFGLAAAVGVSGRIAFKFQYGDSGNWYDVPEGWIVFGTKDSPEGMPFSYILP